MKKIFLALVMSGFFGLIFFNSPALAADASLSLSPKTQNVTVGDNLTVDINLNTDSAPVAGVDAVLNYPVDKLEYVKTTATTNFPNVSVRDNPKGTLHINLTTGSGTFTGVDKIASVTFKAIKAGQAPITFVFVQGSTTDDSNVNSNNNDILATVSGGTYTLAAGSSGTATSQTSSTSALSSSPTPTPPVTGPSNVLTTTFISSFFLIGLGVLVFFNVN